MNRCEIGDCREVLYRMIAEGVKVQMCVTSPPYWGLRDYGTGTWEGGDGSDCGHEKDRTIGIASSTLEGGKATTNHQREASYRHTCAKCGARRVDSQLGLESTVEEYVQNMVEVFRLVRDVLADDGSLWLNLGDSYASTPGLKVNHPQQSRNGPQGVVGPRDQHPSASRANLSAYKEYAGLKPKDLCGIPWRVAFALQADGWYLRQDIIWHKPNPMPESVTDRPTKSHEYLFLLTKGPRYFYDATAVLEPSTNRASGNVNTNAFAIVDPKRGATRANLHKIPARETRNRRTVWTIPTSPFPGAHFATFPPKLVEPCILAGTSEKGHCPECGARWVRVVEREQSPFDDTRTPGRHTPVGSGKLSGTKMQEWLDAHPTKTTGWRPTCSHNRKPVPDVCLDPFLGTGTVAEVAQHLGRSWIGIDLNPSYTPMQQRRTAQMALALAS